MSQANLAMAANPAVLSQVVNAGGGDLPNLAAAVAAASTEEREKIMKSATAAATSILEAATAQAANFVNSKISLEKSLEKVNEDLAKVRRARAYFSATSNIFPLQKLIGIPTNREILARFPDIEKIPEDFVVVVETRAVSTAA